MTVARTLAAFLTDIRPGDLPPRAMQHAAIVVASTLASAAAGTGIQSAQIIRDLALEQGGRPDATLWFGDYPKLPVASAAQVNALMSDAAASDDSDLRNIMHLGTPLTATALALAERTGATGEQVLAAIVTGYEMAGRIGETISRNFSEGRVFHGCFGAVFAATTAAGRLLGLDAAQLAQAVAISATSIGGLATAADTSTAREYHAGAAVLAGVNAALAAQRGYLAEERILECPRGFFEAYGRIDGTEGAAMATADMGKDWDIVTDLTVKLMPGGHPYHAISEGAAAAVAQSRQPAEQIESITIHRPGMTKLSGPLHPADLIDMAHSPAYFAAAGAADGGLTWSHATPAKISDPAIHALIDKVRVGPQPDASLGRFRQGAVVTVRYRDGEERSSTVLVPRGSGPADISWDQVDAKYRALMPLAGVPSGRIEASLAAIHDLRGAAGVGSLLKALLG